MNILGKAILIAAGMVVLAYGVYAWDYARGRAPETQSALIRDVLTQGHSQRCEHDVTWIVRRYIPIGMERIALFDILDKARAQFASPLFWSPRLQDRDSRREDMISIQRTLRASPIGNHLLVADIGLYQGKVASVDAKVVCTFKPN
jgi:hypothetical protein